MKQKAIDFRELLERVLPLDELPPASRLDVRRALQDGVVSQLERAALQALSQLEQRGAVTRLPMTVNGGGPVLRYQSRDALDVIAIHLPPARARDGVQEFPRASLPAQARADLGPVRRLLALDDRLVSDPGQARPSLLEPLREIGREFLAASDIVFIARETDAFEAGELPEPLDPDLAAEAIAAPGAVLYAPDLACVPGAAAAAARHGARA
ncbi:MAG TPA: hypothetical protein VI792_09515, partial [Candidatus Eisenbacteria bacterium]